MQNKPGDVLTGTGFALYIIVWRRRKMGAVWNEYKPKSQKKERVMKRLVLQLFVIGCLIATYVLPVLAEGGGGP